MRNLLRTIGGLGLFVYICFGFSQPKQPILLLYQEQAPSIKTSDEKPVDPNVPMAAHLAAELRQLGKVEVVLYSPEHPTAERIARERKWSPEKLRSPDTDTLQQLARDWKATYLMVASAVRKPEERYIHYKVTLWQVGQRGSVWSDEGDAPPVILGTQLDWTNTARSAARTVVLRLNADALKDLPVSKPPSLPPATTKTSKQEPPADPHKEALNLFNKGDYQGALPALRLAINQAPYDADLRMKLIEAYQWLGLNQQAQAECSRAIAMFPNRQEFALKLASLLEEAGQDAEAGQFLRQLVAQNPQSLPALLALCDFALSTAELKEASTVCEKASAVAPDSPEVRWRLYLVHGALGEFDQGIEAFPPMQPTMTPERYRLFFKVAEGIVNDLASEISDLRKAFADPNPPLGEVKPKSEQLTLTTLGFSRWLEKVNPEPPLREPHMHLRLGSGLLSQAAQSLARYLPSHKQDDLDSALLYRNEALRELNAAKQTIESKKK